jgi:hypothetical protein
MSYGNVLRSAGFASTMFLLGCTAAFTPQDPVQQPILESLSATAYQRAVPRLAALKAGDRIQQGIDWAFFSIEQRGKRDDVLVVADGWVGPLSGGSAGAIGRLGHLIAQKGNVLFGEHVFGYLVEGATLVPQYVVITQATAISRDEYERLKIAKDDALGSTPDPREPGSLIYLRNVSVQETRQLPARDKTREGGEIEIKRIGTSVDVLKSFTSIDKFKAAERTLESLAPGTDYWEALAALKMMIVTEDAGISYRMWLADGYLGAAWSKLTPKGYFSVFRFGYIQNDKEVPRLALIFKNHRVHKLVPHGTQEELERYFD